MPPQQGQAAAAWSSAGLAELGAEVDAELGRQPAVDLEHVAHGIAADHRRLVVRLGVLADSRQAAGAVEEQHVERDQGVPHPEGDRLRRLVDEQHRPEPRQALAVHQALRALAGVVHHLDAEAKLAVGVAKVERARVADRLRRRRPGGEQQAAARAARRSVSDAQVTGHPHPDDVVPAAHLVDHRPALARR